MRSVRFRAPGRLSRLSRRRVLALAATGVGVSVTSVAGLSLAGEAERDGEEGPLVLSLRDASKGTVDIFSGERVSTITDPDLVARILKAAGR